MKDGFLARGADDLLSIEHGTPAAKRAFYAAPFKREGLDPTDANILKPSHIKQNGFLSVDELGHPTIFLKRDAGRIVLREEFEHFKQFQRWKAANAADWGDWVKQGVVDQKWSRYVQKNRITLELEAHKHMLEWARRNGTSAEVSFVEDMIIQWTRIEGLRGGP